MSKPRICKSVAHSAVFLKFAEKERSTLVEIHIYGKDKRLSFCGEQLKKWDGVGVGDFHLLPIPTRTDGEVILGTGITLAELCSRVWASDVAVGYNIPEKMREALSLVGAYVIDVATDEGFVSENAELTAIGTLGRILCECECAPSELSVGVIGFGRIGQHLVRQLLFFGANVRVFTSKTLTRNDLCMLGIDSTDSLTLGSCETGGCFVGLDILINTAPAPLICEERAKELSDVRVIELASGENLPGGVVYERFAAVPAKMYPRSAGYAMCRAVLRMLGDEQLDG